ncbi:MAG TPA: phage tail sheath subtilisin-like domain-containing protein [Mycobacterium sp.]|jgi:hypothetical protein
MAVQVSWPGVYIDEFTPGAPIQGVGTNTPVFLGIAEKGPRNVATKVSSWDQFSSTFGGFLPDPGAWLAHGVYGFFANGGMNCYVVRVSKAKTAKADLPARKSGNTFTATAVAEGPDGNGVTLVVKETSRSIDVVARAMTRTISHVDPDLKTLTVGGGVADIDHDDEIKVTRGTVTQTATVDSVTAPDQIKLKDPLPNTTDFTGGFIQDDYTVRIRVDSKTVTTVSTDRTELTLSDAEHGFSTGDAVHVTKNTDSADALVTDVNGAVVTVTPLTGTANFNGGNVRSADLPVNTRRLRLLTPAGMSMSAAFPPGSLVAITPEGGGASTYVRVAESGGDTLQLDAPGLRTGITLPSDWTQAHKVETAEFDLQIHRPTQTGADNFTFLSMDKRNPGYWAKAVTSSAVALALADPLGEATDAGDDRPAPGSATTSGGTADNYADSWQSLTTTPTQYLDPLGKLRDVSLIAVPGGTDPTVQQALVAHCETLKDRFAVLDAASGLDPTRVTDQFAQVRSAKGYAALYYPWISVRNPSTGDLEMWPPSGHILGVYARTDAERGVHKAPANTNIRGALGVETTLSDAQQGPLNLLGVNVLRVFPGQAQPVVWGARTSAGDLDTNWLYVDVRRLFIYLEQSIDRGIRWAVFEPNDLSLWQKLKRSISDFLTQAWRDGALFGAKPEDAFYVRIDEALNPPSTRALGRLYIEVGVVPTYPAEFIILRIGIWDGGSEVTTT